MKNSILKNLFLFTRPHAFAGTTIQSGAIFFISKAQGHDIGAFEYLISFFAILFMHIYGMGVNQIADIEIDKINKPFLPLASGDFKLIHGQIITLSCLLLSLFISFFGGVYLVGTMIVLGLGLTFYSLPPFKFKLNPWAAGFTIALSRSIIYAGGFFLMYSQGKILQTISFIEILFLVYIFLHAFIFAISKDVPDVDGDKKFHVDTFAGRFGTKVMGLISRNSIFILMVLLVVFSWDRPYFLFFLIGQTLLAFYILRLFYFYQQSSNKNESFTSYYMGLWKVFYAQLILFSIAAWI